MAAKHRSLMTIGYEGAALSDFIATLHAANVTRLIDVRELPISRRKGFAKNALSSALAEAGIEYIHLKGLGDPKPGREAARRNQISKFKEIFSRHMKTESAQIDLKLAAELALQGGVCLMCFERDHHNCHRSIIASAVCDSTALGVRHLGVRHGLATNESVLQTRA